MKIDTGNFGNAQREVVSTQINRGDVSELAEAKVNAARNSERLQGMANQAWDRLGGQMQQVGAQMQAEQRQLAQQKSALVIQQKQLYAQGVLQEAQDRVDSGQLKSADLQKYVSESMGKFAYEDIDGLDEGGRMQLSKGLQGVDMSVSQNTTHLYRAAHKVETRATTDEMIANNERLALNSGQDLDKAASLYDSPLFQTQAREAYGAEYGKVISQAKSGLYAAGAKKMVLDARDSYSGLQALEKEFQEGGKFHGKLDADQALAITGQIDSRKSTLEAQAAAAEARAAAQQQAAIAKQQAAENHGMAFDASAREFINNGGVPDNAFIERYARETAGTSYARNATTLMQQAKAVQEFRKLPLTQQEQQLSAAAPKMRGNPQDMAVFKALQNSHEAQKKELVTDPIAAVTSAAGVEIPALPMQDIENAKDPAAVKQANQNFAEVIYQRAKITDQARAQTSEAPKVLLTAQERTDFKAYADKLPPGAQMEFYKKMANAGGRHGIDLVKEISGSDVITAAAYHSAVNPHDRTGAIIAQGQQLLTAEKTTVKAPDNKKIQAEIDSQLSGALPPMQRATVSNAVNAHYVASRMQRGLPPNELDSDDYQESIKAVVGDVIQYGDSKVVVPAGTDANKFRETLYNNVMQQPDGANQMALIESGQARLQAVGAKTYMLTTPSGATYFDPKTGQPVRIQVN
ncbi:hypothetical protein [Leclercia sp. Marseille-Q4284]|uniref:hypothetical protein n=1 Tax=Leclercia sp. Marseille-Q4284 TaxID=2866582 RepID=UPI001CE41475|nr:hypothetical protein [Leclercia sp. Marseille-Q4284]